MEPKTPHKTQGDAIVNMRPACHIARRVKSWLRHPSFRKLVLWGPPSTQAAPGVPSRGVTGFMHFLLLSPPRCVPRPGAAVPRFLGLGLHLYHQPPSPILGCSQPTGTFQNFSIEWPCPR